MLARKLFSRSLFSGTRKATRQADWWLVNLLGRDGGDPGHWNLVTQWVGGQGGLFDADFGKTVFSQPSQFNGLVEVTSHPCSDISFLGTEKATCEEWRVLRFNQVTRQSCARVDVNTARARPECLAQDYLQSIASVTIAHFGLQMSGVASPRVLMVGLGGGSLPLFFSHYFPKWQLDVVEIDPVVVRAATEHMGFPSQTGPNLHLYVEDAFDFLKRSDGSCYDIIIVDAFNGENNAPDHLKGDDFAAVLAPRLHSRWGTVIFNLHAQEGPGPAEHLKYRLSLPSQASTCYTIGSLHQANRTLVAARGLGDSVLTQVRLQQAATKIADELEVCFDVKSRVNFRFLSRAK